MLGSRSSTLRADLLRYCEPGVRFQDATWSWRRVTASLFDRPGVWAVLDYRFRSWGRGLQTPARQVVAVIGFVSRRLIEILTGIQIAGRAEIGPGLFIGHFGTLVVGGGVVAGENLNLSHAATLGDHDGSPRIGNCVFIGPGARVFGPISVGDHVAIGANAVVNQDVPAFSTAVAGNAKILVGRGNLVPDDIGHPPNPTARP